MEANNKQVAGDHYKKYGDLQPWDVVIKWNLGYLEGTALKYIARWRDKGGIDDIKKAIHFLEKLVEINTPVTNFTPLTSSYPPHMESKQLKPVDFHSNKRFHDPLATFKQPRNSHYPVGIEALEEWTKKVAATKALNDYYERDV